MDLYSYFFNRKWLFSIYTKERRNITKFCVWVVRLICVLTVTTDSCVTKSLLRPTQFLHLSFDEQRATLTWNVIQFDVVYNWTRYNENKINNFKCMAFLQRKPNGIEMSRWLTDQCIDRFYLCLRLFSNGLVRNVKILQRLFLDIFRFTSK